MASSSLSPTVPSREPPLQFRVDTPAGTYLGAEAVGRLLRNPNRAFQEYFAETFGEGEVAMIVSHLRVSSVDFDLIPAMLNDGVELVGQLGALYGTGKVAAGFVTHLSDLFGMIMQGERIGRYNAAKSMFGYLATLVARGLAISITINIPGVNTPLVINGQNAPQVLTGVAEDPDSGLAGAREPDYRVTESGDRRVTEDGSPRVSENAGYLITEDGDHLVTENGDPLVGRESLTTESDPYLRDENGNTILDEEGNPLPTGATGYGLAYGKDYGGRGIDYARRAGEIPEERPDHLRQILARKGGTGIEVRIPYLNDIVAVPVSDPKHLLDGLEEAYVDGYVLRANGAPVAFEVTAEGLA